MPDETISDNSARDGHERAVQELLQRQAQHFDRVIQIGSMLFGETDSPPPITLATATEAASGAAHQEQARQTVPPLQFKIMPERLSLDQVRSRLPFSLCLPISIPDGFKLSEELSVVGPGFGPAPITSAGGQDFEAQLRSVTPISVHLSWKSDSGAIIQMSVSQRSGAAIQGIAAVPRGAVQNVAINGVPAALIERQFAVRYPQNDTEILDDLELCWESGEMEYSLRAIHGVTGPTELVRMATTIPAG